MKLHTFLFDQLWNEGVRQVFGVPGDFVLNLYEALEIAHVPQYRCNPIIVLFNNGRWEMLQAFFPDAGYNNTVPWPFARLADLWGGRGFDVRTPRQLREALTAASQEDRFTLIEVKLQKGDISPVLQGFVTAFKKKVYSS